MTNVLDFILTLGWEGCGPLCSVGPALPSDRGRVQQRRGGASNSLPARLHRSAGKHIFYLYAVVVTFSHRSKWAQGVEIRIKVNWMRRVNCD